MDIKRRAVLASLLMLHAFGATAKIAFDPLAYVAQTRITTGDLTGGFLIAPAGYLNWYFVNLGLLPFVGRMATATGTYLDLFISRVDKATLRIVDYTFANGDPNTRPSDSDDAYASTFLSLAVAYAKTSADAKAWFLRNLQFVTAYTDANLASPASSGLPAGMIPTRQRGNTAYLIDMCENYGGLSDFAAYLSAIGQNAASKYSARAQAAGKALADFYKPGVGWNDQYPVGPFLACFYADKACQVYPQAFRAPVPAAWMTVGYNNLNNSFPTWPQGIGHTGDNPNPPPDCIDLPNDNPWAVLGYVAALRGDTKRANQMTTLVQQLATGSTDQRARVTINELGWYQKMVAQPTR